MSGLEQRLYFSLGNLDKRVFRISDIINILRISEPHARNIAKDLVDKEAAIRIKGGLFVRVPESVILEKGGFGEDLILIASEITERYFLSHYTALSLHGLTDRFSKKVLVSSPTNQRSVVLKDGLIDFIRIVEGRYFGMKEVEYQSSIISVSDIERTLFDVIERPELSGGWIEVIECLSDLDPLDEGRLLSYMVPFNNKKATRVLAYLMSMMESIEVTDRTLERMHSFSGSNKYYLDRRMGGTYIKEWELIVPEPVRRRLDADKKGT